MAMRHPEMYFPPVALLIGVLVAVAGAASQHRMSDGVLSLQNANDDCGGQQTTCHNSTALQVCADLGTGYVPVGIMPCEKGTPFCSDGRCVGSIPPPTPPTPEPAKPTTPLPYDDVCNGKLSVCAGCYVRTVCARLGNGIVPVSNVTCGEEAPYCVSGTCRPDLPADSTCAPIPAPESKFQCYSDGYFPDPSSCNRYHLCVGSKAFDYDCPRGLVYDQTRALCTPSATCAVFNCRGRVGQYQLYQPDNTLYALCITEDSKDALVASCPPGHRLKSDNPLDVHCEAFCAKVGRFADPADTTGAAYLECLASYVRGELVGPISSSCPVGSLFDELSERCKPINPTPRNTTP
ncbi:hypothetical protein FOCC_FOCC005345, partial [Frankliniella occidentalis]